MSQQQRKDQRRGRATPPSSTRVDSATPATETSWEPVAKWYDKWAGKDGSRHHQNLAIPTVLSLLAPLSGKHVIDVGCGTGVLAPHVVSQGARYVGVDASPKMLKYARKRYPGLPFYVGDAARLDGIGDLGKHRFDAAVMMLSLQDMKPLDEVVRSASRLLRENGAIVLLINHPCFRVPRQSGWGWDDGRKLQYRRIDRYLTPLDVPFRPIARGQPGAIHSFHRPLQDYVNALSRAGLLIDQMVEVPAFPGIVRKGPKAKAENAANREIPVFLGIRAIRLARASE